MDEEVEKQDERKKREAWKVEKSRHVYQRKKVSKAKKKKKRKNE